MQYELQRQFAPIGVNSEAHCSVNYNVDLHRSGSIRIGIGPWIAAPIEVDLIAVAAVVAVVVAVAVSAAAAAVSASAVSALAV